MPFDSYIVIFEICFCHTIFRLRDAEAFRKISKWISVRTIELNNHSKCMIIKNVVLRYT